MSQRRQRWSSPPLPPSTSGADAAPLNSPQAGAVVSPTGLARDGFILTDMASVSFPVEGAWAEVKEWWHPGCGSHIRYMCDTEAATSQDAACDSHHPHTPPNGYPWFDSGVGARAFRPYGKEKHANNNVEI